MKYSEITDFTSTSQSVGYLRAKWAILAELKKPINRAIATSAQQIIMRAYQKDQWVPLPPETLRENLDRWLWSWDYPSPGEQDKVPQYLGVVTFAGDVGALSAAIDALNEWKLDFKSWHAAVRQTLVHEVERTRRIREVLKVADLNVLNLQAADRLLYFVPGQLQRLRFERKSHPVSKRETVADALIALETLLAAQEGMVSDRFLDDYDKTKGYLSTLADNTPLQHRLRPNAATSFHFKALPYGEDWARGSGANPIFLAHPHGVGDFSAIEYPKAGPVHQFTKTRGEPISPLLYQWFEYLPAAVVTPAKPRSRQSTPKSGFKGLRITNQGTVIVSHPNGVRRTFKRPLQHSMMFCELVASKYCEQRPAIDKELVANKLYTVLKEVTLSAGS